MTQFSLFFKISGVGHCEDLSYLFENGNKGTEQDFLVRKRFVKMVANFAYTGNPTPNDDSLLQHIFWKPNTDYTESIYQMDINKNLNMLTNPRKDTFDFWVKLFDEKGLPPYSTF